MSQVPPKFLVDVGVGKKVERWLLQSQYDVKAVRDISSSMEDDEILQMAVSESRIVLTMDKDFGELVYNFSLPHAGVLLLRLEEAKADEKVKIVKSILENYADQLPNKFSVFQNGRLRIR
ncbi:MAG: DUF5615 family PIN-like protein [Nitrospira sp.]|nr:DUF5615 family PIN-like protein [Nitrospira sp.]